MIPLHGLQAPANTVLVTGGAGYLGRFLLRALVALGCTEVRSLDVRPAAVDGVVSHVGDIRDRAAVERAVDGAEVVFHAAAVLSFVGLARRATRERIHSINVRGTENVVAASRAAGVGRLVATSSANVVIDRPLTEADETEPYGVHFKDLYGPTKAEAEALVLAANSPAMTTCALRPGGIWGPEDGGFMIRAFLEQLAAGRFVATIGDGRAVVDNTHVYNLVRAELLAATAASVGGRAYFITDDERHNGVEWFRPLVDGLGHSWPRVRLPGRIMYGVAWLGEVAYLLGAPEPTLTRGGVLKLIQTSSFRIDRARAELGYAPIIGRDEGLAAHMSDYRALYASLKGAR